MKKFSNFCGIFATLFVTTTIILLVSCSQDDDYYDSDMYTLAEMGTRLGGEGGDPGGGALPDYDGYYTDPNNCGGVALAILYGEKETKHPKYVYRDVKDMAGGSCSNMTHTKVCSVGKQLGLYCSQYEPVNGEDVDSVVNALGDINGKIVFIDIDGGPVDHAIVGRSITKKTTISHGDTIVKIKIKGEDRSGNVTHTASKIVGIIR